MKHWKTQKTDSKILFLLSNIFITEKNRIKDIYKGSGRQKDVEMQISISENALKAGKKLYKNQIFNLKSAENPPNKG